MTKPDALMLANQLQQQAVWHYGPSVLRDLLPVAAAELRRLNAEVERLSAALAATPAAPPPELCEQVCAAIKAADDKSVEEAGYMLDSNDCIAIVRKEFARAALAATPAPARCANGPMGCDYPRCDCNGASTKESKQ